MLIQFPGRGGGRKRKKGKGERANGITFDEREIKSHLIMGQLKFPKLCSWKTNPGRAGPPGCAGNDAHAGKTPAGSMDLCNTHPFPSTREQGEGYCLANNGFILPVPPDNALISLPQPRQISPALPGETARGAAPRAAGKPGLALQGTGTQGHPAVPGSQWHIPPGTCPPSGLSPLSRVFLHPFLV